MMLPSNVSNQMLSRNLSNHTNITDKSKCQDQQNNVLSMDNKSIMHTDPHAQLHSTKSMNERDNNTIRRLLNFRIPKRARYVFRDN